MSSRARARARDGDGAAATKLMVKLRFISHPKHTQIEPARRKAGNTHTHTLYSTVLTLEFVNERLAACEQVNCSRRLLFRLFVVCC